MDAETREIQDLPQPEEELAAEQTEAVRGGLSDLYVTPSKPVIIPAAQSTAEAFKK